MGMVSEPRQTEGAREIIGSQHRGKTKMEVEAVNLEQGSETATKGGSLGTLAAPTSLLRNFSFFYYSVSINVVISVFLRWLNNNNAGKKHEDY